MRYSGTYGVLLVLHLLAVAFVVGPAAVAAVLSPRHVRAGRVEALRDASRTTRLYTLATVVTVVLGSALVAVSGGDTPRWSTGEVWVSASYALWLVAVAVVLLLVVPAQEQAAEDLDAGRDASRLAGRIAAGAGLAMLCWTAIIVLMVVKPA